MEAVERVSGRWWRINLKNEEVANLQLLMKSEEWEREGVKRVQV